MAAHYAHRYEYADGSTVLDDELLHRGLPIRIIVTDHDGNEHIYVEPFPEHHNTYAAGPADAFATPATSADLDAFQQRITAIRAELLALADSIDARRGARGVHGHPNGKPSSTIKRGL